RFGVPLAFVRANPDDPRPSVHQQRLVAEAVAQCAADDVPVFDAGFRLGPLQAAGVGAYVVRVPANFTARRAQPPAYRGRGRPPTRGALVRPLARRRGARLLAATPPDQVTTWHEGATIVRAELWHDLVLPATTATTTATATATTTATTPTTTPPTTTPTAAAAPAPGRPTSSVVAIPH